jgi:hypothetical protein
MEFFRLPREIFVFIALRHLFLLSGAAQTMIRHFSGDKAAITPSGTEELFMEPVVLQFAPLRAGRLQGEHRSRKTMRPKVHLICFALFTFFIVLEEIKNRVHFGPVCSSLDHKTGGQVSQ